MNLRDAIGAADHLSWLESVIVGKTRRRPSILDDDGFLRAVLRVARTLREEFGVRVGSREFRDRVRRAAGIDWRRASSRDRDLAIEAISNLLRGLPTDVLPGARRALEAEGRAVGEEVRRTLRQRPEFDVSAVMGDHDLRAIDALATTQSIFFAPEYERRAARFRERAQSILIQGLDRGADRREISRDLAQEFEGTALSEGYFETVAAVHVNRARTFSALATYAEAGVDEFEWVSILDSRTTELCQDLNGRVFSVRRALDGFDGLEDAESLGAVRDASPLLDADATADEFIAAGGFAPPAHFRCRATLVPRL